MDSSFVADGAARGKVKARDGLVITESMIAGLLAMRRYGRITRQQYAAAGAIQLGSTYEPVRVLKIQKLISVLTPGALFGNGRKPDLIGLSHAGNRLLEDEADLEGLPLFSPPTKSVVWGAKQSHKLAIIDAMIAAERDLSKLMDFYLHQIRTEFRRDPVWGKCATGDLLPSGQAFKPDAVLTIGHVGDVVASMAEIDMGSEPIITANPVRYPYSITGKLQAYWAYLASGRVIERFGATVPVFQVLFITTTRQRITSCLERIDWTALAPIGGVHPRHVFRFTTHEDARRDFYGRHWLVPGRAEPRALIEQEASLAA